MKRARIKRLAWTTLALLAVAWALPLAVRVNFWKSAVAAALSNQLHRPVQVGDIHLRILDGLGVEVDNVAVAEDPAFGSEPFARVDSLAARLALSSIWRGRIEFSSLVLSGASFNIVRNGSGNWNLASLGGETAATTAVSGRNVAPTSAATTASFDGTAAQESAAPLLPRIQIDSGRINFKSEDRKRAWCLEAVSLDLFPPGSPRQPWRFELSAMPTRTDIPFHATSSFRAEGEFGPFGSSMQRETGVPLRLDWSAENALLVDLLTIGAGRDLGVDGVVNLHGHMAGTSSLFRVSAESEIKELHRWDLFPNPAAPSLRAELKGIVDLSGASLELSSLSIPLGSGALAVRGRAEDLFDHPRANVDVELRHVSLGALAALGPQFTARLDRTASAEGMLDGTLRADGLQADAMFGPLSGSVQVSPGYFQPSASAPRLRFTAFDAALASGDVRFGPVRVTPDQGGPLQLSGEWDAGKRASRWRLGGDRIALASVEHAINGFGITWSAAELTEGTAAMRLEIATSFGLHPSITGTGQIFGVAVKVRGMAEPLRIASARLLFERGDVKVQPGTLSLGPVELGGNVTIKLPESHPADAHPGHAAVEFNLDSPVLDLQELALLFSPRRPSTSFFSFAGSDSSSAPAVNSVVDHKLWEVADSVPVTGTLHAAQLRYRGITLENLKASLHYQDRRIEIPEFSAEHSGGTERGMATVSFHPAPVSFTLESRFANVDLSALTGKIEPWTGLLSGRLSGNLWLESSGRTLDEIVSQLSGSVNASGRDVVIGSPQWAEALGEGIAAAETRIASFTSSAQIANRHIHIAEMKLIPARLPRSEGTRALRPALWWITGDVDFNQSLHLTVQQDPEGGESYWAGTLAEPRRSRNVSNATTARENASLPAR
jgi:AsmA family